MKLYIKLRKNIKYFIIIVGLFVNQACTTDLEAVVYSDIIPSNFYQNEKQLASAISVAYTPLYNNWFDIHDLQDAPTDQTTMPIRVNGGWNDGGSWPRLMNHDFRPNYQAFENVWNQYYSGVGTCNRLIEIIKENVSPDAPSISEIKVLRAFYYLKLLDLFGDIPIVTKFKDAAALPFQSTPSEVFSFIESELLESIPNLTENKNKSYAKVNKWVAYTILADLYLNAERFGAGPHYDEAAEAANMVINGGEYSLESGYFKNFRVHNETSSENIFVIPFEDVNAGGLRIWTRGLHQSARPTFGLPKAPFGGYSIQENFYNSFEENDLRRGMFISGQQYTIEAGPKWSDTKGFYYTDPDPAYELVDCKEDVKRMLPEELLEEPIDCSIFITPEITLSTARGIALYREGARYGKYEIELNPVNRDMSNDFVLYRYAEILLIRAEALFRVGNNGEALNYVNMVRERAGVAPLNILTENDLYSEWKKELAIELHARPITIRFGHWEDSWFLKEANPSEMYKRFYPIPTSQLQANTNLVQNIGY